MESQPQQVQKVKSINQATWSAFLQDPKSKQYRSYLKSLYGPFTDLLKLNEIRLQPNLPALTLEYGPYSLQIDKQIRSLKNISTAEQRNLLRSIFLGTYMNKAWKNTNGKYLSQIIKDFESMNQQKKFPQSILQMDQKQDTDLLNFQSMPYQSYQQIQYKSDQSSQKQNNQSQLQNQNQKSDKRQDEKSGLINRTIKDMKKRQKSLRNLDSNNSQPFVSIQPSQFKDIPFIDENISNDAQNSQISQKKKNTSKKMYPSVENDQMQSQQSEIQSQKESKSNVQQQEQKQSQQSRSRQQQSKKQKEKPIHKKPPIISQQRIQNNINQKIKQQNKYKKQQFDPNSNRNNQQNRNQYPISFLSHNFNYPQYMNPLLRQNIIHSQQWDDYMNQRYNPNPNIPIPMGYPYLNHNHVTYSNGYRINKYGNEINRQHKNANEEMDIQDSSQQSMPNNRRLKKLSQGSTSKSVQKRSCQQYRKQDRRQNKRQNRKYFKKYRRSNRKQFDQQQQYEQAEQRLQQKKRISQILQGLRELNSKINPQILNKQSYMRQDDNKTKQQLQQLYNKLNEYKQFIKRKNQQQIKQLNIQQQSKTLFQNIQQQYNKQIIQTNKRIQISIIYYKPNNIMNFNTYYQSSKEQFINNITNINSIEIYHIPQLIHSQHLNISRNNQSNYINIKQFYDTYQIKSQFYIAFNNLNQFINTYSITKYIKSLFIQKQIINSFTYSLQSDLKLLGAQIQTQQTKQYICDLYYKHYRPLFENPINNLKQLPINISPNQYDKFIKFIQKQLPNKILKNPFKIIQKDKLLSIYNKYKNSVGEVHKLIISQIAKQTIIQNMRSNQSSYKQIIKELTESCIRKYYQQLSKIGLIPNGQTYIDQQPLVIINLYNVKPLKLSTNQQLQNIIDSLSSFVNKDKIKSNIRSANDNIHKKKQLIASITQIKTSLKQQFNKHTFLLNYKNNIPANLTQNLNKNQLINFINFIKKYINYDKILYSIKNVIQNTNNSQDIHNLVLEVFSTLQNQCNQCNEELFQISLSLSSKFKSQLHIFAKRLVWKYLQIKKDQQNKIIKNTVEKSTAYQLKIFTEMFLSNNKPK